MIKKIGPIKLGNKLKAVRKEKHLPLQSVAESSKISATYLQKLESGMVNNPSPGVLQRLSDSLDISYLMMMELIGYIPKGLSNSENENETNGKDDLFSFNDLSAEEKNAVYAFIRYLKEVRD